MSLDQDAINQQLTLLATHRRTLAHLVEQAAAYGGAVLAPPQTATGIEESRSEIARIKIVLREGGVQVEEEPNEEGSPQTEPVPRVGGDVVAGDKVSGDKVMGDKRTVDTGGGDYAEGDIGKRQGIFIECSTLQGPVIADNEGTVNVNYNYQQVALAPALHQLRAPVGDFVGREREIDQLVQALTKGGGAAISGVRGMGGIGKTELAYVVANRLKDKFSDAQLIIEMRGASSSPLTPEQALQRVIHAFERGTELPDDLSQLQGIYRSVLTGKKVLILADDAEGKKQVRPLMPPSGCALLVTSRNRFSLQGMQTLDLELLSPEEAAKILLELCPRIGEYAGELAKLCGHLPLGLRVSASLLKENDSRSVARYLEQLRAERLKYLSDPDSPNDSQASVEASLRLSYNALGPVMQTAFCRLGVFPASFDLEAAKSVVIGERDVVEVLELLRRRSLLEWDNQTQRYSLHDLVREFAAAQLKDADAVRLRHAQFYETVLRSANDAYKQGGAALMRGLVLFDTERVNIEAGQSWAATRASNDDIVARLCIAYPSSALFVLLLRHDPQTTIHWCEPALQAAIRLKDRAMEGALLGNLGLGYFHLGMVRRAIEYYEQQLAIMREIGNRWVEGTTLLHLGIAYAALGAIRRAIDCHEQALVIAREVGDRHGEGNSVAGLAMAYKSLGELQRATDYYAQALVIAREVGDLRNEVGSLNGLGSVYLNVGAPHTAIDYFQQALIIARALGDRRTVGAILGNLGAVYTVLGKARKAIESSEQALGIHREYSDRRAEGNVLNNLGNAYANLGKLRRAIDLFEQHLVIARELGDRQSEAKGCWNLGQLLFHQGDLARALELMQICVDYLREIGYPDAEQRAAYLEHLRQRLAPKQSIPPAEKPYEG